MMSLDVGEDIVLCLKVGCLRTVVFGTTTLEEWGGIGVVSAAWIGWDMRKIVRREVAVVLVGLLLLMTIANKTVVG